VLPVQRDLNQVVESTPPEVDEDALTEELIAAAPPGAPTESTPGRTDRVADSLRGVWGLSDLKSVNLLPAQLTGPAQQKSPRYPRLNLQYLTCG
jgi:hypothetical protein